LPAPKAPSFIALSKHTGKLVWSDNSPGEDVLHGQWSSPAYGVIGGVPQVIFAGGDGWLRAFEALTGKPLWRFDLNPKEVRARPDAANWLNHVIAMPVIHGDRVYIGAGMNPESGPGVGDLWCVAPAGRTGDLSEKLVEMLRVKTNPNSAVIWHHGGANSAKKPEWNFGRTISTVAVHDGLVYAAEIAGLVHCFDAASGAELWQHDQRAAIWGSPLWVDGKVLIGDEDGKVTALRHGREKEILGTTEFDGVIHTSPVVAGGVVYVMTDKHLYALRTMR
jgi:outer membrane protein assembly factor BamB